MKRHVTTARAYGCLLAAGRAKASWFAEHFLATYLTADGRDIGEAEACGISQAPTPISVPPPAAQPTAPGRGPSTTVPSPGWTEQETPNHPVNTFTNYHNASGQGAAITAGQWVQVSCKAYDPFIGSVNPDGYWYRISSGPWNNGYYAPANTFMNGDPYGGPYTHNTDFAVANC